MKRHKRQLIRSCNRFRLEDQTCESLREVYFTSATIDGVKPIRVDFYIVQAEMPVLLEMGVLYREDIVVDMVFNLLLNRTALYVYGIRKIYLDNCFITLVRSHSGHVYVPLDRGARVNFKINQLHKVHRQFFNPSNDKISSSSKRNVQSTLLKTLLTYLRIFRRDMIYFSELDRLLTYYEPNCELRTPASVRGY